MERFIPFLLLPIYFGALAVAIVRFAPRTADDSSSAPQKVPVGQSPRERTKRTSTIGLLLFALYWVGVTVAAWWQMRHTNLSV